MCVCADPGPGLLHDDVLSVSESGDLLRLATDLAALQHMWIVSRQRGTDIDPPSSSSSFSSSSPHRLFFPTLALSVTFPLGCHRFTVFLLTIDKHSVSVIPELVPMVCSVSKANFL